MMRVLVVLVLCACTAPTWARPAESGQSRKDVSAATAFALRVRTYVALQKNLEGGAEKPTTSVEQIAVRQDALLAKLVAARRDARQGDIFTLDVATFFRDILHEAFEGSDGRKMRRTILEGDPERAIVLHVNAAYPEDIPVGTMPPMLLHRLPALPSELRYRLVGRALVLKDVKTNLIVDFIPDAMARVR
jgi:hypothetical protein